MYLKTLEENLGIKQLKSAIKVEIGDRIKNEKSTLMDILKCNDEIEIGYVLSKYRATLKTKDYEQLLINLLVRDSLYIQLKSFEVLSHLYSTEKVSPEYIQFAIKQFDNCESNKLINHLLICLGMTVNRIDQHKIATLDLIFTSNVISKLREYLNKKETQYNALVIIWIFSFEQRSVKSLESIFKVCLNIINDRLKERNTRVCVSILRNGYKSGFNFLFKDSKNLLSNCDDLLKITEDFELKEDLRRLKEQVEMVNTRGNTLENFYSEMFRNELKDSFCHNDVNFWIKNRKSLITKRVEIVKALKKYLKSQNPEFIRLAAVDVHMLVKHIPDFWFYFNKFGVKDDLFELCTSSDEDVKFYSLQALTTCIFAEWN